MAASLLLLTAAGPGHGNAAAKAPAKPACETAENVPTPICHVYVLYQENQAYYWVMHHAPSEDRTLPATYAIATQDDSAIHYSFPNYLASTAGFVTNYQQVMARASVVDLVQNHSPALRWDAFMQGMPTPCYQSPTPNYRTAHNPFVWYADVGNNQTYCKGHDLTLTPWASMAKASTLPPYGFIAPDVTDDRGTTGLAQCDAWLASWLPQQISNPKVFSDAVFFITYDESTANDTQSANGTAGGWGHIYTAAVSPFTRKAYKSTIHYNHYSLLTTTEWLLGLGRLGSMDNWTQEPP